LIRRGGYAKGPRQRVLRKAVRLHELLAENFTGMNRGQLSGFHNQWQSTIHIQRIFALPTEASRDGIAAIGK